MLIDLSTRPELVCGADHIDSLDGACRFHRLPQDLAPFYQNTEGRQIRMACTAGVRLMFHCNSRLIRISVEYGPAARQLFALDLSVDDGLPQAVGGPASTPWTETVFTAAERRPRRFCLWLTHCAETRLRFLEIEDGSSIEPLPAPAKTWLLLGDSITQGMTCTTPGRSASALLAARLGCGLRNTAIGGERMEPFIGEHTRGIAAAAVTVAFGTNDFNGAVGADIFAGKARGLLGALLAGRPELPVGLITPIPWAGRHEPNSRGEQLEDYRRVLRELAPDFPSVRLIEGPELVPDAQEFFVDRVHPNDRGMAAYAAGLEPHLRELLG